MTKTNETIADIIAEMRGGPIPQHRRDQELLRHYADRLEAAWKRKKATTEKSSAVGNGAKLREALKQIASIPMPPPIHLAQQCAREMREKAIAALAAPPRNCDKFGTDNTEASLAYEEFCDRAEVEESVNGAMAWLLSLDADKKEGNDGR